MKKLCISIFRPASAILFVLLSFLVPAAAHSTARASTHSTVRAAAPLSPKPEFYALRIYRLKTPQQESRVDSFLQFALLPALHRQGIPEIGVFKPVSNNTDTIRSIYVFIPLKSLEQFAALPATLTRDAQYLANGMSYLDATYDNPPYVRLESILLQAFPDMPRHANPWSAQGPGPHPDRIYELRSYEGPTDKYFANKVEMFNQGGEIKLFDKLGFHAVFYSSVISGAHMPNLMYMVSFDNMPAREEHWKTFGADTTWKRLSASPQYQHNVSHIDVIFMHPADYSEL